MKKFKTFLYGLGKAAAIFALICIVTIIVHSIPFNSIGEWATVIVLLVVLALLYSFDLRKG